MHMCPRSLEDGSVHVRTQAQFRQQECLLEMADVFGALADPVRRGLYRWVVAQAEPVSRDQAAEGAGVPRHTAKFHLDRLAADGLLETEFRRLTGRRGPG